ARCIFAGAPGRARRAGRGIALGVDYGRKTMSSASELPIPQRHAFWVRVSHWLIAFSVLTLAYSGFYILLVHPRLYWGEVGNDLTPALLELPLNDNHRPEAWQQTVTFEALAN